MAARPRKAEILDWLRTEPSITELTERFPREWEAVRKEAAAHAANGDAELRDFVLGALEPLSQSTGHARPQAETVAREVRRRMLLELLRQAGVAAETGRSSGTIRFNALNGKALQWLFFENGLRRKPVSMVAYHAIWPMAWQRSFLLPLVRRQGIYCFYSRPFISRLLTLIGDQRCVELAAGDGTLARFLRERGCPIEATDDFSWTAHIDYDNDLVQRLEARKALARYAPRVVICSWPPPSNTFEQRIFTNPSVEVYVVITSTNDADAGNWHSYRDQTQFDMRLDRRLSRLVLPRGKNRVLVFTRRSPSSEPGPR